MNDNKRQTVSSSEDTRSEDIRQQEEETQLRPRRSISSGSIDMQFATAMDRVTMPTPEAAKMARYADFPVSPSLGTADISIPIYEINTGRLKLPISLQYTTSGIKVNEISGPVGLGWHLNAGGVITRTICGVKDGEPGYLPMQGRIGSDCIEPSGDTSDPRTDIISIGTDDTLSRFASGDGDTQYDRYTYSFMGHTGSFIVRDGVMSAGNIETLTPTDLVIEPMTGSTSGFKITDTDGTIYEFTAVETSSRYALSSSPTPLAPSSTCGMGFPTGTPTAWHLTRIVTMDGLDSIKFEYDSDREALQNEFTAMRESFHKTYRFSYKYIVSSNGQNWHWRATRGGALTYSVGNTPDIEASDWRYQIYEGFRPRRLRRIVFREHHADFEYADVDIMYPSFTRRSYRSHLRSISVNTETGSRIMSASLGYIHTEVTDGRELLSSVTFKGSGSAETDNRTMTYYDTGTVMLPQAQDLFGYYNGATGNTTLVPFKLFQDNYTINEVCGDRSYNAVCARALSLKSIRTKGGAYTEIEYEGNSVQAPSTSVLGTIGVGIRVARIITGNRTKPEGMDAWDEEQGENHEVRIRSFSYSNPVLTIPAYDFTHNRFITASECSTCIGSTWDHTWEDLHGPERTCTVTIGDQSVHGGAPLESAMIVYGKVSEKVQDPGASSWHRTEYTFSTADCMKPLLWAVVNMPSSHDVAFAGATGLEYGWGFHLFQRVPGSVTREYLSPSVSLTPPSYLFGEANCPKMTMPAMVRRFIGKTGPDGPTENLGETVTTTYETVSRDILTGYSVRNLLSLNTSGQQNTNYRCLCDYSQTEFHTRMVLVRAVTSETVTYRDGTTDPAAFPSDIVRAVRTTYSYEGSTRTGEHTGMSYPARTPLSSVPDSIYTMSPRTVETSVINYVPSGQSWQESIEERYTRHYVYAEDFTGDGCTPEIQGLISKHYRKPVGEELFYGDLPRGSVTEPESDSRFISFRTLTLGGQSCIKPYSQRTFRNRTLVRTDLTISEYDSKGNPVETREPGMPVRSYIWGYRGMYPVAEFIGLRSTRPQNDPTGTYVNDYLSQSMRDSALSSPGMPDGVTSAIAQMRSLSGVLATTRTMTALIGPSSVTDPFGLSLLYAYDTAGRLSLRRRRGAGATGAGDLESDWLYDFTRTDGLTNSIRQRTYTANGGNASTAQIAVTRLDGLGRTVQSSQVGASPLGGDIVQPFAPDFLDREDAVTYLPYREASSNAGAYRSNAISSQASFHENLYGTGMGQRASSRKNYEPSSRNKVESTSLPGHNPDTEKTVTTVNAITSAEVLKIRTDAGITAGTPAANIIKDGHWSAGSLVKTTKTGPDGSVTQVFSNALGSTVLERKLISGTVTSSPVWSSAYYVRDIRDRVVCVVPPDEYDALVVGSASSRSASGCYVYMYDNQDRVIYRRLPDCSATLVEYDAAGRITKETTGSRIFMNEYDSLGRLVSRTYRYGTGALRTLMEYTYDSYPSTLATGGLSFGAVSGVVTGYTAGVKGLKTSERVRVLQPSEADSALGADSSATYVTRAFYYDNLGRLVQTVERNHLGQVARTSVKYDFTGNVIATRETQTAGTGASSSAGADTAMTYDREGRITGMSVTLSPVTAYATYGYDAVGRPATRTLGSSSSPAAVITDSYTIQGWLSQRSSTPFTSQLKYSSNEHGTPSGPGYAGNITEWKTYRNGSTANGSTYAFTYDLMSRLKSSSRYAGNSSTATNPYTEKDITYFADSRIKTIKRYGASASSVQNLSFATDGNTYDSYRNVTRDATSGASVEWNILNLPRKMTTAGGVVSEYTYLADGTKVRMKSGTTTLHYLGSMVFSQAGSASPVFESMAFCEGRIVVNSSGAKEVHYHITDHLGSVRSVVKADGTVIAENDYYPYGKRINTTSATTPTQKDRHTFSGKEDQSLTPGGTPYLDFGARMYTPETGKWLSVDVLSERTFRNGNNVYCDGNPVNAIDLLGLTTFLFNDTSGVIEDGSYDIVSVSEDEYNRLVKLFSKNNNKYKKQLNRLKDSNGFVDESGNFTLAASYCYSSNYFNIDMLFPPASSMVEKKGTSYYNERTRLWKGKNNKYYDFSTPGNQFTGGKLKYAKYRSDLFKKGGKLLNIASIAVSAEALNKSIQNGSTRLIISDATNLVFSLAGLIPVYGTYISWGWTFVGDYLFNECLLAIFEENNIEQ